MPGGDLEKKLDKVFSKYIRERDSLNGVFICCACGQVKLYEQADAGHFINRRWRATRWHEQNVHAECRACNRFDEGNSGGYALFMIRKYGQARVEYLQALSRTSPKFTDSELSLMINEYKEKTKKVIDNKA